MADRAVSETLGFVLVFALVTSTVGVVYVSGIGGLTDARNAEQVNNAERAFDVLADNMADIHQRNAPSRATEIKLADAQLGYGETTELSVEVSGAGGSPDTVKVAPIVYTDESESEIVYEAGAVIRDDSTGGAVMKREPNMVFRVDGGDTTAILPLLQTRTTGSGGVGGSSTVLVRGTRAISEVLTARTSGGYTVTFTVDTTESRAPVWKRYLEAEMDDSSWSSDCILVETDTLECEFEVDRLYVTATGIDVSIS